jgi:hypothetical protein
MAFEILNNYDGSNIDIYGDKNNTQLLWLSE